MGIYKTKGLGLLGGTAERKKQSTHRDDCRSLLAVVYIEFLIAQ